MSRCRKDDKSPMEIWAEHGGGGVHHIWTCRALLKHTGPFNFVSWCVMLWQDADNVLATLSLRSSGGNEV